jgi:hypothetical protein
MNYRARVVLLWLALIHGHFIIACRSFWLNRLTNNDTTADSKNHVQHVQLTAAAAFVRIYIRSLEELHELAAVEDRDLRISVLEVEGDQAMSHVTARERRWLYGRLRMQPKERIAHGCAANTLMATGQRRTVAALASLVVDRILNRGENNAGEGHA